MVVLGGWVFSYERGAPVGYGPEGPLLQEEVGNFLSRWSFSGHEAVLVEDQAWLKSRRARSP